ncbi:hypothetical protein [Dyella terrae]|uniref:hypothetical protein n=1 Tax=Dyella terrae TaxID=522259 RepID=UPI0023D90CE1|nr:hypothetical protein [Dyella terrae]ULU25128.1 hypothetical protein DYST_02051 [Dyella terrae]
MKANSPALPRRLLALALAAASVGAAYAATPVSAPTTAKPDVVADHIDTSVKPGDDFFEFANGAWLKSHPIPAEESQWGIGQVVQDELYTKLRKISEDAAADKNAKAGSDQQKVGDFWTTAMDQAQADKLGITPLNDELARIDAVHDVNSALDEAFALQLLNVGPFFDFQVSQDESKATSWPCTSTRVAWACRSATTTSTKRRASPRYAMHTYSTCTVPSTCWARATPTLQAAPSR